MGKVMILSLSESEEEVFSKIMDLVKQSNVTEIERVKTDSVVRVGDLVIDSLQHIVHKKGQEICLTNTEFRLLHFLAIHKGMVMSKDQIYECIWNGEIALDDSNITSHIRRLRVKIEDNPTRPIYIQTVRGIGYKMPRMDNVNP